VCVCLLPLRFRISDSSDRSDLGYAVNIMVFYSWILFGAFCNPNYRHLYIVLTLPSATTATIIETRRQCLSRQLPLPIAHLGCSPCSPCLLTLHFVKSVAREPPFSIPFTFVLYLIRFTTGYGLHSSIHIHNSARRWEIRRPHVIAPSTLVGGLPMCKHSPTMLLI